MRCLEGRCLAADEEAPSDATEALFKEEGGREESADTAEPLQEHPDESTQEGAEKATEEPQYDESPVVEGLSESKEPSEGHPNESIGEAPPEKKPPPNIGALCQLDSDCSQSRCLDTLNEPSKICSLVCEKDEDCPLQARCDRPKAWSGFCKPRCQRPQDCAALAHLPLCLHEGHCGRPRPLGGACLRGDECQSGLLCADPGGLGAKICTKACIDDPNDPKAPCGGLSFCEAHSGGQGFCVPLCLAPEDCRLFSGMPHCNFEGHCWRSFIQEFQACTHSSACLNGSCVAVPRLYDATICTEGCKEDLDCPLRSACFDASPQQDGYCIPTCQANSDCPAPTLYICNQGGFCGFPE